jgi:hypothetical protein
VNVDESAADIVRQYISAWPNGFDTLARLRTDDFIEDWPQTGERIHGDASYRAIHEHYPGGLPEVQPAQVSGTPDQWAVSPLFTLVHLSGAGATFTVEGAARYPDGANYKVVVVLELSGGRVRRQRTYFAPELEAPSWRAQWVERI